eukprot:scaffold43062_cov49-Phaeocystis_antarctica.AAC.1
MRTFPTGIPPASQPCTACSMCALLPVPCSQSAVAPSTARCVHRGRPPPPACRSVHLSLHRMPSFRLSAARVGVQPAAELRHLQRHNHVPHVLRARSSPCPAPNLQSRLHCALLAPPLPAASHLPTRTPLPAPHALISTLGSTRRRSTSR